MTDRTPPPHKQQGRPENREVEYEEERPDRSGQPPRPAQEPRGSEGTSNSGDTLTDPSTGEPNP